MAVTFINLFEVQAGRDEAFLALWQQVNAHMRTQPGYQSHQLHRALADGAPYRYANVAIWESADAWRAAHNDTFRQMVTRPEWQEYPSTPALYELVHTSSLPGGA